MQDSYTESEGLNLKEKMKRLFSWAMFSNKFDNMEGHISKQKALRGEQRDKGMSVEHELIMKYHLLSSVTKYILVQNLKFL
jgi:hypothetical protein